MNIVVSLLHSLGVDSTLWLQLGCFFVSYVALTELVFKPYLRASNERENRTVGSEGAALKVLEESKALQQDYEKKARVLNAEIKSIYERQAHETHKERNALLTSARHEADHTLEAARRRIAQDLLEAHDTLLGQVPELSSAIASRLAGKELS
jgi:F0F1-type ATP synthase membrane subunit b/b'